MQLMVEVANVAVSAERQGIPRMSRAIVIIVAAGSSRRMGFNKLLAPMAGHPVLWHSVKAFDECREVDEIHVVASGEVGGLVKSWITDQVFQKLKRVVEGGAERRDSVWSGLQGLPADCDVVAIHDGARPLIQPAQIEACIDSARHRGSGVSARAVTETLKRVDSEGWVSESIDRTGVWIMETPQVFLLDVLLTAYRRVMAEQLEVTDEVSAMMIENKGVFVVANRWPNLKVTFPADLELAERLMEDKTCR